MAGPPQGYDGMGEQFYYMSACRRMGTAHCPHPHRALYFTRYGRLPPPVRASPAPASRWTDPPANAPAAVHGAGPEPAVRAGAGPGADRSATGGPADPAAHADADPAPAADLDGDPHAAARPLADGLADAHADPDARAQRDADPDADLHAAGHPAGGLGGDRVPGGPFRAATTEYVVEHAAAGPRSGGGAGRTDAA